MHLTAARLAQLVGGRLEGSTEVVLTGAEVDSRLLAPGHLFVALPGARCDGHDFVEAALTRGGAALVRQDAVLPAPPPERALIRVDDPLAAYQQLARHEGARRGWQVLTVTGSVGKTTCKEFLVHFLRSRFRVGCSKGNRNSILGLPAQLLNQPPDTEVFVAEAGMSRAGELDRLAAMLQPEVAIYTRLAPVHTEFFPDGMAGVIRAKGELLHHLADTGTLVINAADPHQKSYTAAVGSRVQVRRYGAAGGENRIDLAQDKGLLGSRFQLVLAGRSAEVQLHLPGGHQQENLLAAATAASVLGITAEHVAALAPGLQAAPHRGRLHHLDGDITVVDDSYNSSPVALAGLLDLLAAAAGRRVAVLGEMYELGALCDEAHRQAGARAARSCDLLVTVGAEPAATLAAAARQGGLATAAVQHVEDAAAAAQLLGRLLEKGDVVLVKGSRGVGLDQTVAALLGTEEAD